jgi:RimJ/RimL family protein N-acetyltransferase
MEEAFLPVSTERCLLRPAALSDYDALVAGIGSPDFPRELPLADVYRQGKLRSWLDRNLTTSGDQRACLFSIDLRTGERCVGQVSLTQRDQSASWNLAFWLNPSHWGKGLALEAAKATLGYGFTVMGVPGVWAGAALWNQRSIRTLINLGLQPIKEVETDSGACAPKSAIRAFSISRDCWTSTCHDLRNDPTDGSL